MKEKMAVGERMISCLRGRETDRMPRIENSVWWNQTVRRWLAEGLPARFADMEDVCFWQIGLHEYFGLDKLAQFWVKPYTPQTVFKEYGHGICADEAEYERARPTLFGEPAIDPNLLQFVRRLQNKGDIATELILTGPFWEPRELFGIENHMFSFFDHPALYRRMTDDLLQWHKKVLDIYCSLLKIDFVTVAEDMSYNNGPMIGKDLFDAFVAPYYREMVPLFKEAGLFVTVDSDGDIKQPVSWYNEVGVEGYHPLEKQAGMDVNELQDAFPHTAFMGNYDKMQMPLGERAMRAEFERLAPAIKRGRYIVSVDHQTPPGVSLENYRIYRKLLQEYSAQ